MMSLILLIDCAGEEASVHLGEDAVCIGSRFNKSQKDHAAWVHQAVGNLLEQCGKKISELSAVAVSEGPGSYTGLRVAMSTAKGICYALQVPLIVINSLKLMAANAVRIAGSEVDQIYIPMIDARRMEVFTAAYNSSLQELMAASPIVLSAESFSQLKGATPLVFTGSGASKWMKLCTLEGAIELPLEMSGQTFLELALEKMERKEFADLAYAEPFYLKEFFNNQLS